MRPAPELRGFTLLEVVVSVAILGIASTALFSAFGRSIDTIRRVDDLHRYQLAAEEVMNRVLLLGSLPGRGTARGRFDHIDAEWTVAIEPWIPERLDGQPESGVVRIDVAVGWDGRSGPREVRIETVRPSALYYDRVEFARAIEEVFPR
jgi:prepilin-type N-terminal cleavage/methylation domain-containing protein